MLPGNSALEVEHNWSFSPSHPAPLLGNTDCAVWIGEEKRAGGMPGVTRAWEWEEVALGVADRQQHTVESTLCGHSHIVSLQGVI